MIRTLVRQLPRSNFEGSPPSTSTAFCRFTPPLNGVNRSPYETRE
jgi:hypothetical protein